MCCDRDGSLAENRDNRSRMPSFSPRKLDVEICIVLKMYTSDVRETCCKSLLSLLEYKGEAQPHWG